MRSSISRRQALRQMAGLAAVGTGAGLAGGAERAMAAGGDTKVSDTQPALKLSAYACDGNVWVRIDDEVFCCYRTGSDQKYPYLFPVFGPLTRLGLTEESSVPWPHHRSLFLGCDHVNEGNYWQDRPQRGQILSRGPKIASANDREVNISDVCDWRSPDGRHIIEDHRSFRVTAPEPALRILDCRFDLRARVDIRITRTNHSLFAVRAARGLTPLGGGTLVDAEGRSGEKATFGQSAPWCGFQGTRFGRTESIVLMDHPRNPWFPCRWFTRDYGFASPTPFFWLEENKPWQLPAEGSLTLRYRVVILGEAILPAELKLIHSDFSSWA